MNISVDGKRLWQRLMDMAAVGATEAGGSNRQALSDEDHAGRKLFEAWCEQAGCEIRRDAIGNIFARRQGKNETMPPVLSGSHLDTQPTGGKFDGVYGVLAALEVIETLNDYNVETNHPIEVVVWTNEEGSRFDCAMMGSAVWSGTLPLEDAYALKDLDGISVEHELDRLGLKGNFEPDHSIQAAFELHIEQGPILEAEDKPIGVVTGVQHMCRYRIGFIGQETHAGTSPMSMRRDPMMAAAEFVSKTYALAEQYQPDGRVTFGYIHATPGSPNTVPGRVELTLDLRHPQGTAYHNMQQAVDAAIDDAADKFKLDWDGGRVWEAPGVVFDTICIQAVREAAEATGLQAIEMVSGAGHDACNIASVAPVSMIFIPCDEGLSHNEAENISADQAAKGADVLLYAMLSTAVISTPG